MLGERIRAIRTVLKENQTDFAYHIGITQGFLSAIERGEKIPGADTVIALKNYSNCDANWLLTGEGEHFIPNRLLEESFVQKNNKGVENTDTNANKNSLLQEKIEQVAQLERENELLAAKLEEAEKMFSLFLSAQREHLPTE